VNTTKIDADLAAARAALCHVYDPELALDVVSLGLVYDLRAEGERIIVEMTLTTPGCPVSESLPDEAAAAVAAALGPGGAARVEVRLVWDPPWTPELLSDDAAGRLGFRRG
jgi:metal-sulfur cluster biosynthetic enzyme